MAERNVPILYILARLSDRIFVSVWVLRELDPSEPGVGRTTIEKKKDKKTMSSKLRYNEGFFDTISKAILQAPLNSLKKCKKQKLNI
jgi:hypothetical protein